MSENNQFYADNENDGGVDIANIDLSIAYEIKSKATSEEDFETAPVAFFCRDCRKIVATKKAEKGIKFACAECGKKDISFGTRRSLTNHFHLNEEGIQKD